MRYCRQIWRSQRGCRWEYGACALRVGRVRTHACKHTLEPVHPHPPIHTHTHTHTHRNMYYLFIFDCYSGFVNAPRRYVKRTLDVLFILLKCSGCFGCHIICCFLYPSVNCITLSWVHSILTSPLNSQDDDDDENENRRQERTVVCVILWNDTCSRRNCNIPLMRRAITDIAPNKPVTKPHNQLLIGYVVTSPVHT